MSDASNETAELQKWIEEAVVSSVAAGTAEAGAIVADTVDRWYSDAVRRQWVRAVAWRAVTVAMAEHLVAAEGFPDETDNDRLAAAFRELDRTGIVARDALGISLSDGWALMREAVDGWAGDQPVRGGVFYHEQDLRSVTGGGGLCLAFGTLADQPDAEIGTEIVETLRRHGLTVDWNGDPDVRIQVAMRWQVRRPGNPVVAAAPAGADFWPPAPGPLVGWSGQADRKEATVGWLRARRAAGELVCADEDGRVVPTAPGGGFFPGYLTAPAVMAERGIDDQQFAGLMTSGNLTYSDWEQESERLCGVPALLLRGFGHLFKTLPPQERADFVVEAVDAIPVGADLSPVCDRWILDLLTDPDHGVIRHTGNAAARAATETVAGALRRRLGGDDPSQAEWQAVRDESYAAGAWAAFFTVQETLPSVAQQAVSVAGEASLGWQVRRLVHHVAAA